MSSKETKNKKTAGKKRKKGKMKEDPNKLSNVDQTFYELTINDLNNKLSRLRSRLISIEETNHVLSKKVQDFEEIRDDITCHLERVLTQNNELIAEHEETILELKTKCEREKSTTAAQINNLGTKYNAMKDQLYSEIKLLKGQLSSLHEFRRVREILYKRYDEIRLRGRERVREHEEQMYQLQQKAAVERDNLKQEMEGRLLQIAQDFTRSSEIRNAAYTHRLIRENIALRKETEKLVESQIKMQKDLKELITKNKLIAEEHMILKQLQKNLVQNGQNKIDIIEKLTGNYERLKTKYVEVLRYRDLYEKLTKRDQCGLNNTRNMTNKMRCLSQHIESMKLEKSRLLSLHKRQEYEIERLRDMITQLKNAIKLAMGENTISANVTDTLKRTNLLTQCINIINSYSGAISQTSSLATLTRSKSSAYYPGQMGLIPPQPVSLMEIFKNVASIELSTTSSEHPHFELKLDENRITPKERVKEAASIIDVEWSSLLYVSSSHEDLELPQIEDKLEDIEGEEDSSSSFVRDKDENNKEKSSYNVRPTPLAYPNTEATLSTDVTDKHSPVVSTSSRDEHMPQSTEDEDEYSIELFY